jgi:hypothetical protein
MRDVQAVVRGRREQAIAGLNGMLGQLRKKGWASTGMYRDLKEIRDAYLKAEGDQRDELGRRAMEIWRQMRGARE